MNSPLRRRPPAADPRPRIVFLARYTAGGSAAMLRLLAEGLDQNQFEPVAIFHTIRDPEYTRALEAAGIEVVGLVAPWRVQPPAFSGLNASARLTARPGLRGLYQTARAAQQALALDLRWQPALARRLLVRRPSVVHCI